MDVGRMCVLHGVALCLHAAWSHCSYVAARVELVGVLGCTCLRDVSTHAIETRPYNLEKGQ